MADLSSLLQLGQQMQGRLSEIQSQLAQQTVTVSAGGGMVQATADGRGQIRAITIAPEVVRQGDVEMLEDLVLAAVAEAQKRAAELRRDATLLCVVEEAKDVAAIERAGRFRGHYHVLGGRVSPLDGVGPDALRIVPLVERVRNGSGVREVIVATNPSMEGEVTATY